MKSEKIKKEFIQFMEDSHKNLIFPKNFIGCMMSVFIEQKLVTQERVMELTGYSLSTVSQMLNLIQRNMRLDRIKEPKIRKKSYTFYLPPRIFMFDFFQIIIESFIDKIEFVLPIIEELNQYTNKHEAFLKFQNFLKQFYEKSNIFLSLHTDTSKEMKELILSNSQNESSLDDSTLQESLEYSKKIKEIFKLPLEPKDDSFQAIQSEELLKSYIELKNRFYQQFRATLQTSQLMTARSIIGTELLLENRPMTQVEIEENTHLARSLISEALNLLLEYRMVKLIKKSGDRKNYYLIYQSWDVRMINRIRASQKHAKNIRMKLYSWMEELKQDKANEDAKSLLTTLSEIHHSYAKFEQFYKILELRYFKRYVKD